MKDIRDDTNGIQPIYLASENAGQDIRKRAEAIARDMKGISSIDEIVMTPEEINAKLHELLVHQIELEMQNDELRHTQSQLEEAQARYLDLYDLAPVGYCAISEEGLILEANLTAADLLGMARGAVKKQPITYFILNDDQDIYYLHKRQLFLTGEPQSFEIRMSRNDGSVFWAQVVVNAMLDVDGKRIYRVILSDITKRKLDEEELVSIKESLSEEIKALNRLHEISTQFICQDNLQSIYEEILKAAIAMSYADKGIIQIYDEHMPFLRILAHSGLRKTYLNHFESVSPGMSIFGKAFAEKKRIIVDDISKSYVFAGTPDLRKMLDERIVSVQATPMISSSGNVLGIISTYYITRHQFNDRELRMFDLLARQTADVIERARIENALQQSEHRALDLIEQLKKEDHNKNEFISALSHELRNPLATIMAGIYLLSMNISPEQATNANNIIRHQTDQLCRLVDDLLDLTRITRNKIQLKMERINISKLAFQTCEDLRPQFIEKGVGLETQIDEDEIYLDADAARVTQIIGNLLNNSIKFTDKGGLAALRVYKENDDVVICVQDNGIGLSTEMIPILFKPFTQADNSLDRSKGGLGLGLSIVKGMTELHGGTVSAYSEGEGKGVQFIIRLPIHTAIDKPQQAEQVCIKDLRSLRVLAIDDNKEFAMMLVECLEQLGHNAIAVHDGPTALARAKEYHPDIIFCDIGLPGMNGYEIAKLLKCDKELKDVYLVALSGYAQQRDMQKSKAAGFNCHMAKPVNMEMLESALLDIN